MCSLIHDYSFFIYLILGVWMLHCHYEHHHYRGMSMAFVVGEGEDGSELEPPPVGMPAC